MQGDGLFPNPGFISGWKVFFYLFAQPFGMGSMGFSSRSTALAALERMAVPLTLRSGLSVLRISAALCG